MENARSVQAAQTEHGRTNAIAKHGDEHLERGERPLDDPLGELRPTACNGDLLSAAQYADPVRQRRKVDILTDEAPKLEERVASEGVDGRGCAAARLAHQRTDRQDIPFSESRLLHRAVDLPLPRGPRDRARPAHEADEDGEDGPGRQHREPGSVEPALVERLLDAVLERKHCIHRFHAGDRVEGAEPVKLVVVDQVETVDRRARMLAAPDGTTVPAVHLAYKRMPTGR